MGDVRLTQDRAGVCHLSVTQPGDATHAWQTPDTEQVFAKHPGWHLSVTQVMQTPGSPGNAGNSLPVPGWAA